MCQVFKFTILLNPHNYFMASDYYCHFTDKEAKAKAIDFSKITELLGRNEIQIFSCLAESSNCAPTRSMLPHTQGLTLCAHSQSTSVIVGQLFNFSELLHL